jgi:GTP cyclohydrolase II
MLTNIQELKLSVVGVTEQMSPHQSAGGPAAALAPTGSKSWWGRPPRPGTIARVADARLPTKFGEFRIIGYRSRSSTEEFVVLVRGELRSETPSLVRIHSQCMTGDVFGSLKCDCGQQLRAAMQLIAAAGHGAIIYQQQEGRGISILNKIRAYALQDAGADTIEANELLGLAIDMRRYDQCAEVFLHLGLRRVRVMSNNPAKIEALERAGLEVVERMSLDIKPHDSFARYLRTKKERMGHFNNAA